MNVLVDTPIWSLALRRAGNPKSGEAAELAKLIREGRATIIGPIRQELLSGIRSAKEYERLRQHLRAFPDLILTTDDFELAAEFYNRCRACGIQASNTDYLICAVAFRRQHSIYTADRDFTAFSRRIPVELHQPRA